MAQSVTIAGITFPDVPSILVPKSTSGNAIYVDPSPTTATASDVAQGKAFFTALGELATGTASGGGGMVYETGTFTPESNVTKPVISFSKTHTDLPALIAVIDSTGTSMPNSSLVYFALVNWDAALGGPVTSGSSTYYGYKTAQHRNSSGSNTGSNTSITSLTGSSNSSMEYYVTQSDFTPYGGNTAANYRSNRTYKWIAVWKTA